MLLGSVEQQVSCVAALPESDHGFDHSHRQQEFQAHQAVVQLSCVQIASCPYGA